VEDVATLYDQARLFVAPTRFAAGIPYKVHEAAAHGLPVVCTTLLAGQLGWQNEADVLAADPDDAQGFADAVAMAYLDPQTWLSLRDSALLRVAQDCSHAGFTATISDILDDAQRG
jgi:glycosyltransferase involved in cell wall biosynthesis